MTDIYCKVIMGGIVARRRKKNPETKLDGNGHPIWRILVERGPEPPHDPFTQHAPVPTEVIEPTQVTQGWSGPTAKTQQEQDDYLAALQDGQLDNLDVANSALKALAKGLFLVANDVRVLKGQQPITAAQFRNWLKAQM